MKKTGEITDVMWHHTRLDLLNHPIHIYRLNRIEKIVHRPQYNVDTKSYDLFFDERFEGIPVWQIMKVLYDQDMEEKKAKEFLGK